MKRIFNFSVIVALLSMMASAIVSTSCSNDDEDSILDSTAKLDWSNATSRITATAGTEIYAKNQDKVYTVKVISAEPGNVVVKMYGNEITLSDDGDLYLSIDGESLSQAAAALNPTKVLLALRPGTQKFISGTAVYIDVIKTGANLTLFYNGEEDESNGEDDEPTISWTNAVTKIDVMSKIGDIIYAKNNNIVYTFKILSAQEGEVVVEMNGKKVTLSDAGSSYLGTDGNAMYQRDGQNAPEKVLLALLYNTTNLISGTLVADTNISRGANETIFASY